MNTNMNTYIHKETCGHTYMHHDTGTCSWHPGDWRGWILNVEGKKIQASALQVTPLRMFGLFFPKVDHKAAFAA